MTRNLSRRKFLAYLYLVFSIIVFVLYPLYGFYIENKSFSLEAFLTAPIFGNYRLTLSQLLLDVDSFLANFITLLLFCIVFAFFAVYYGPTMTELGSKASTSTLMKRMKVFGGIAAGILGVAILLSVTQLGYVRPELAGKTFEIMFLNFFPENFSVQVIYYFFLFAGWPGILYLAASTKTALRRELWAGSKTNAGMMFVIIAAIVVEIMFFVFPLVPWVVVNSSVAVREILFSLFDILFLTGLILVDEMRCQKSPNACATDSPRTASSTHSRYQMHAYGWGITCVAYLLIVGWLLLGGGLTVKISAGYFISRIWGFGFAITLTLFLVSWGRWWMIQHKRVGEIA